MCSQIFSIYVGRVVVVYGVTRLKIVEWLLRWSRDWTGPGPGLTRLGPNRLIRRLGSVYVLQNLCVTAFGSIYRDYV
ncbi:hypothetical protein L6452_39384 [Arctium lappa]|uniref:Uncharacterized protein n=1 Tax=Arctium lappa TaxID=4217 RepID=A0ACB8XRH7_ARCLA|nr:hypothetical protein L6452_39384 [Arctium lappa]